MSYDMNPKDDEQDEEELFVFVIAELIDAHKVSQAKLHLRSYVQREIDRANEKETR
jgi:hypothetical protein